MLDRFEDCKNLHNTAINASFPQLLHSAMTENCVNEMSELSSMFIELEIFATSEVLQKPILIPYLNKERTFLSRNICILKHSN